jgi:asparagine synthase (glutamine-hydrolysing)
MCGIAGTLSVTMPADPAVVGQMTDCLRHRGPDAEGVMVRGPAVLGHRRLAIIDVRASNNQPLPDHSGQYWIVFNGEIYNYQEIRRELEAAGAVFRTSGDTEVILEAYKRWGVACLQRFNGMFAFALWDEPEQRLFLARDRAGEKPLYYQVLPDGGLIFASELTALRTHPAVSRRLNPSALGHYLSLNYTLTSACIVDGVQKLPAAHYLLVSRDGGPAQPVQYWDLARHFREKQRFRSEAEAAEALAALVDDAVRLRMVSDVPLGAFLSGGIDSSAVVAAMCQYRPPAEVDAFSIGFQERSFNELPAAQFAARELGASLHSRIVDADLAAALPAVMQAADEPIADTSMIPMYYLAQFARQRVTVCLSGDGSDEMLAGYETYPADRIHEATRWVPRWLTTGVSRLADTLWPVSFGYVSFDYRLRKFLHGHPLSLERAHYYWRVICDDTTKHELVLPELRRQVAEADPFDDFRRYFDEVEGCHFLDRALYVDLKTWLVDDILVKVDRATMAHSLEARAPFLDHRLLEFAASLPVELKLKRLQKKYILKQSQRERLPAAIVDRRKHGFNAPVSFWFHERDSALSKLARAVTLDDAMAEWFDRRAIDALWQRHQAKIEDNGLMLFGLTCLGLWLLRQP